ncbi:MAG: endonuclease MutS2 [Ruminococcaceae bacterium]|nr:endonuclease MutS2 [Oscillospiraceae bacterium]
MNKHYETLELNKILEMLKAETSCEDAAELALSIQPSSDFGEVCNLLSQTEDAFSLLARFGAPSFSGLNNVGGPLTRAAAGGSLSQSELLKIGYTLRSIRTLYEWRGHCSGVNTSLDYLFESITVNKYLEDRIFACIISEDEIADKASELLSDIRRKIRAKSSSVREKLDSMIHSPHYTKFLQEPIVTQRSGRFVVPVKAEHRGDVAGLVHDTSSSGATVFIEPVSVVEANNDIKMLEGKERDEIARILYELSSEAGNFADSVKQSYYAAVQINLIFAKAHLAFKMKAAKPIVNAEGEINLRKARHPLIDKNKVVPIDVSLGEKFDTLVITGPNTGGKTVSIKTIGLLTLMTMCGLLIPASDKSKISIFNKVLVDIGDEQSIQQNLSTFSSHMTNTVDIMAQADESSLVLIDELGAGTDPTEGAALAVSIIEYLRSKGARIAATTHYAELKAYALDTDGVTNGCCEFDVETLSPTYRLLIGVPGRSNAFAISQHLGMDEEVINNAKRIVGNDNRDFEAVLEKLEETRHELENELLEAQKATERARKMESKAQSEKDKINTLREREMEKAKHEAEKLINQAKRQSSEFLLELEKLKREQNSTNTTEIARKTRRAIKNQMGEMDELVNPQELAQHWDYDYKLPREPKAGDSVIIRGIGEGEIIEIKNDRVYVKSGMIKTRVKLSDIMLADKKKKAVKTQRSVYRTSSRADSDVTTELDLRGQNAEEALQNLGIFIDKCVLNGMSEVRIIHGKGMGVLRSAVQEELRHHPNILEYRLGKYGEGEDGVTIAKLK